MWVINVLLVIILAFNPSLGQSLIASGWQLYVFIPIPGAVENVHNFINHLVR